METVNINLELLAEPGPSTDFRPSMSLSPLPLGGESSRGVRPSTVDCFMPTVAAELSCWCCQWYRNGFQRQCNKALRPASATTGIHWAGRRPRLQANSINFRNQGCQCPLKVLASGTNDSLSIEAGQLEQELSEEEGLIPDQPIFKGLFRPHLFKALLFKAKNSIMLGTNTSPEGALVEQDPAELLFSEPTTETEAIPAPLWGIVTRDAFESLMRTSLKLGVSGEGVSSI